VADTFQLKLLCPYCSMFEGPVEAAMLPGEAGEFGVLANHTKFASILQPGVVRFVTDGETQRYAVGGGFVEVGEDGVIVLADSAEHPDEIDTARAEKSIERAHAELTELTPDAIDRRAKLEARIARAKNRLRLANSA
jgi:F-type H+-transporting ATPase subunit epsilon